MTFILIFNIRPTVLNKEKWKKGKDYTVTKETYNNIPKLGNYIQFGLYVLPDLVLLRLKSLFGHYMGLITKVCFFLTHKGCGSKICLGDYLKWYSLSIDTSLYYIRVYSDLSPQVTYKVINLIFFTF